MKFRLLLLYLIILLVIFSFFSIQKIDAQISTGISVEMIPSNPAPHENTTITLKSYADNLDATLISWSVNGKNIISGIGKKSFSTDAPNAGEETVVIAVASLSDGVVNTRIIIRPSVMVLLWQATDSYVPPFYRGKALPTADSEIKITAMPEIKVGNSLVDSKNMTYYWKKDYTNNVDGSGYGKNFFTYINDYLEDSNNISVTASTIDQKYSSNASIDIRTQELKLLFYKNDKTLGTLWQNSLTSPHKIQEEEIVEAIPYFISPKQLGHPSLLWDWYINDSRVDLSGFRKNLMPLQAEAGTHGTSQLRLEIENREKIFQTTSKEINIEF